MFGKKRRALEARVRELELWMYGMKDVQTWEFGMIPANKVWHYLNKLLYREIKQVRAMLPKDENAGKQ